MSNSSSNNPLTESLAGCEFDAHSNSHRCDCISGLPPSGSWQDLKDHMREAGDVCYADVFRDGSGVVEYEKKDDMKYALRKLDGTKFKSHEVCSLLVANIYYTFMISDCP